MEDVERKIIQGALHQFITYGMRAITMDDVARDVAISKKTLYRYVANKEDLVQKCVEYMFTHISQTLEDISNKSTNAIDELFDFDAQMIDAIKAQKPEILIQLRRYYPSTHTWLNENRMQIMLSLTERNLKKGVKQGMYRSDMNIHYIALMYYSQSLLYSQEELAPDAVCSSPDFIRENLIYHLRGIVSKEGLTYLETKLKHEK